MRRDSAYPSGMQPKNAVVKADSVYGSPTKALQRMLNDNPVAALQFGPVCDQDQRCSTRYGNRRQPG